MIFGFWGGSSASAGTYTVLDLATGALQDLSYLAGGEVASADDAALALDRLNGILDWLKTKRLLDNSAIRTTWTIVANTTSYTVGDGATIDVVRPVSPQAIAAIGFQDTANSPALEILFGPALTEQAYQAIPMKTLTGVYPTQFYYNPTMTTGTLKPWPVPTSTTLQGVMYTRSMIAEYTAVTDALTIPPAYRRYLRCKLAIEMAPAFHLTPSDLVVAAAAESLADIKTANVRMADLDTPDATALFNRGSGVYDINVGP